MVEQKSEALKFVLETREDFEQIKIAWHLCYNERQLLVHEFSASEYMRRFPAFDLSKGYELVNCFLRNQMKNEIFKKENIPQSERDMPCLRLVTSHLQTNCNKIYFFDHQFILDADAEYKNIISTLQVIAPKFIDFALNKKRKKDEFKSLTNAYNELSLDLDEESPEIRCKKL